jgi:uncharacterized membrane-anchored protein YhcB (DUF1043 family)
MKSFFFKLFALLSLGVVFKYFFERLFKKKVDGQLELDREEFEKLKLQVIELKQKVSPILENLRDKLNDLLEKQQKKSESNIGDKKLVARPVSEKKISKSKSINSSSVKSVSKGLEGLNDRQTAIFRFIKSKKKASMSQLTELIPDVSERTLRRDMDYLESKNRVKQVGKTRDSYYQIVQY